MVDARLPDGSRVNAVIRPLALNGPTRSIRRFGRRPLQIEHWIEKHLIETEIVEFLAAAIDARASFLLFGDGLTHNAVRITVGTAGDDGEFAIAIIRSWWKAFVRNRHPKSERLLIEGDAGGSNRYRPRQWKRAFQESDNETRWQNLMTCGICLADRGGLMRSSQ